MAPITHREVERKVRIDDAFALAPVLANMADFRAEPAEPIELVAQYYDTDELTLLRWRITLRRREGGADEGWHLKLPIGDREDGRDELHFPLSPHVPPQLADIVSPLLGEKMLRQQAEVRTHRTPTLIRDAAGVVRVEVVDDHVEVTTVEGVTTAFREIEAEASDAASPESLDAMEVVVGCLLAAGGTPSSVSKAASALGPRAGGASDVPQPPLPRKDRLAVDFLRYELARQVRAFLFADIDIRRDVPGAAKRLRISARRISALLEALGPLFDSDWAGRLREELDWIDTEISGIRTAELLGERITADLTVLGIGEGIRESVEADLRGRLASARSGALAALRSDRHLYLVEDLVGAGTDPMVQVLAFEPYPAIVPQLVNAAVERFRSATRNLHLDSSADDWSAAAQSVRIARYAALAVLPMHGKRMTRIEHALHGLADAFGRITDCTASQQALTDLALRLDSRHAFALGRMHEFETDDEWIERIAVLKALPKLDKAMAK